MTSQVLICVYIYLETTLQITTKYCIEWIKKERLLLEIQVCMDAFNEEKYRVFDRDWMSIAMAYIIRYILIKLLWLTPTIMDH